MTLTTSRILVQSFLVLFIGTMGLPALSQEADTGTKPKASSSTSSWDRFTLNAGGFVSANNSGIMIGSQQIGAGLQIDVEDALGLKTTSFVFRIDPKLRFGANRRQFVSLSYFDVRRSASKVLEKDLEIGDQTFPLGTEVSSRFDLTIIRAKYGYSFFHDDRISMGASFGFYIMPLKFTAKAPNIEEQNTHFIAPLPLLGFYSDFKINDKLYLAQSIEFLYLAYKGSSGKITDLNVSLEHKTLKHFGLGAGININALNIKVVDENTPLDFVGKIQMEYSGFMLYAKYYF
ncbi:MAG: hypothetical protein KDC79_01840 [Cyclobacteriaceae bacterium]|nr:hypothetical protein [Cyclobacteriaceae bacterium]